MWSISSHFYSATITLHNPYVDFLDRQSVSTLRCVEASRAILAQHYTLASSSFDITRLHPFVTVRKLLCERVRLHTNTIVQICWYLAAVVQVQLCKYFIETGDTDREYGVWGVINVLRLGPIITFHRILILMFPRFAMTDYGKRSPIGSTLSAFHWFISSLLSGTSSSSRKITARTDD